MMLGNEVTASYVMWLREMKRFIRSYSRIGSTIAQPLLWFLLFGVGFGASFRFVGMDLEYIEFLAPGIVAISVFFSSLTGGLSVIWDRRFGFLKEILVSPVSRTSIILGRTAGVATYSIIQGFLVLAVAYAFFPVKLNFWGIPLAIVVMAFISLTFSGMGLLIGSAMKSPEGFHLVMTFLSMPLFLLSGAFFPVWNLPPWMLYVAYVDPLTYGVDALRIGMIGVGGLALWIDLVLLVFSSVLFVIVGATFFRRTSLE